MRHIFHGKCKYNNCKAAAYADGLCYKHFMMNCKNEKQTEDMCEPDSHNAKNIFDIAVNVVAVLFVVMLWFICAVGAVRFGVYCYRYADTQAWKPIIIALLIIVLAYILLRFILVMLDKIRASKYIFTALMFMLTVYAVLNAEQLYVQYTEAVNALAQAFAEGMKGILF